MIRSLRALSPSRRLPRSFRASVLLASLIAGASPAGAYTPDPPPDIRIQDTQEEGAATLVLETDVTGADIYLNQVFIGRTPHRQTGLPPGVHTLRFELDGFRSRELVLDLREKRAYIVKLALVPRTGWLSVEVLPPDADVFVDGRAVRESLVEVPVGFRSVRAYRFGYREASQTVYVPEESVAAARFVLEPAPFEVSELRIRKPAFNPANPGTLGTAEIRFTVTSFGRGEMEIRDSSGNTVESRTIPPFTESLQLESWNGRDAAGKPLPDGEYSVVVRAFPDSSALSTPAAPGPESLERSAAVRIDSSILIAPKSLAGGISGLALYPDPFTDPARTLRFSASYRPRLSTDGTLEGSAVVFGAQAALGGLLEIAAQGALDPDSGNDGSAGIGIKRAFNASGVLRIAAYLGAAWSSGSIGRETASPPPARLGISAALGSAGLHGGLALEIEVPSWMEPAPRLGARAGFSWADGRFSAGLSAALRTEPLDQTFALAEPLSAALEGRCFLPSLPIALALTLGADFGARGLETIRPGVELSIVF